MASIPRIPGAAAAALVIGAVVAVPGTLGVVLSGQISRARRSGFLPRPGYTVDVLVDPPWVSGTLLRVAFLGDSLVEGVGAPLPGQSLPAQTAYRLAAHLGRPVHMRGLGVASSRIAHVIDEQVPLLTEDLDLVVVLVGANDATRATAPWDFARAVETLAVRAHEASGGAPIVFTGLPDIHSAPLLDRPLRDLAGAFGDRLHAVQRRLALRLPEARYIDMRCEVGDTFRRRGRELFASAHFHPNPAGYALLGEAIARALTDLLAREDSAAHAVAGVAERQRIHAEALAELADIPGMPMPDAA
ncbi:SGNH/GDSL hydrolase family protein [soil metagenome]